MIGIALFLSDRVAAAAVEIKQATHHSLSYYAPIRVSTTRRRENSRCAAATGAVLQLAVQLMREDTNQGEKEDDTPNTTVYFSGNQIISHEYSLQES